MVSLAHIDPVELGARLRTARTNCRMTQEQAAKHLGLARTTLVAIERGDRRVSAAELVAMADCYGVTAGRFLQADTAPLDISPQFRHVKLGQDADQAIEAIRTLEELASLYLRIEQQLGRPLITSYPAPIPLGAGKPADQAEDAALQLRSRLGLGLAPIADLPGLLETELGIRVFAVPLPSKISGAYVFHETIGACVLINANHSVHRQAWTAAHELGHFMLDRRGADVAWRDQTSQVPTERIADLFAAAFLMPAAAIRRRYREVLGEQGGFSARNLIFLADAFHVSLQAMALRLEDLGLLVSGTWEKLRDQGLSAQVANEVLGRPPAPLSRPIQSRFTMIALDAFEKELLSEAELARLLRRDRVEIRRLIDQLHEADGIMIGQEAVGA